MKHKVIVYSAEWCPWCVRVKEWLKLHKVPFEERDVDKDEQAAKDVVEKSGDEGIPVIDVDGKIIKGFDKDALKAAPGITED